MWQKEALHRTGSIWFNQIEQREREDPLALPSSLVSGSHGDSGPIGAL
jgi:hypothetical protein